MKSNTNTKILCIFQEVDELRKQVAMENQFKNPEEKKEKVDLELPSEFECCFCSSDVSFSFAFYTFMNFYFLFLMAVILLK